MSSALRAPSLGPIVGHTTSLSSRIWIRADSSDDGRTVGVAALYRDGVYVAGSAQYFRLRREYSRTGIVDFGGLAADTRYTVTAGSLSVDTPDPLDMESDDEVFNSLPDPEGWLQQLARLDPEVACASFTTYPAGLTDKIAFVFGSCRYPGVLWMKKRADLIFKCVHQRIHDPANPNAPRFFMMVGDQIYADTLPKDAGIEVADTPAEFEERYTAAFGAPNTRKVLQNVPTYMVLDDHEIEDNWVQGRLQKAEKRSLFQMAIQAYLSYQWSHSPRNFGKRLYYTFDCGGHPFFVLDGRTQRIRDDDNDHDLTDNHMLGRPGKGTGYKGQIDQLCEWLQVQQLNIGDRPKFIVSASVFVPNEVSTVGNDKKKCEDDGWAAYPNTRAQLLQTIVEHHIQNVVFLSGDIHCSNVARLSFVDSNKLESDLCAYSVTSSAFFWPYPFADGDPLDYVHDSRVEHDNFDIGNGWEMRYRAWNFEQDDNFTQVDVDWPAKQLRVQTFGKDGLPLTDDTLPLA